MAIDARARQGLRPAAGARLLLDRIDDAGATARYAAWVLVADGEEGWEVVLDEGGGSTWAGGEVPEDLQMLARLTARGAGKRVADGLPAWPPRVLRWRGPGRGA